MNRQIEKLDLNKIIAVDIETVRGKEKFNEKDEFYDVWAWKCRDKVTNVIPDKKTVIAEYINKAALSAEWGKIVCISVGYVNGDKIVTKSFTGEEKDILRGAIDTINRSGRVMLCHNGVFDIPYIRKRFFINGMKGYLNSSDSGIKPWEADSFLLDTMTMWKGIGWTNTSLEELAMCMNVPTPKGGIHGNEVSDYFYKGRIEEIAKYCEGDVATTLNILLRWRGQEILEIESKTGAEKVVEEKKPLIERIFTKGQVDPEDYDELLKVAKGKTAKEKQELCDIVKGALLSKHKKTLDEDEVSVLDAIKKVK